VRWDAVIDFERPPPGVEALTALTTDQGGFEVAFDNIFVAGWPIVKEVRESSLYYNWFDYKRWFFRFLRIGMIGRKELSIRKDFTVTFSEGYEIGTVIESNRIGVDLIARKRAIATIDQYIMFSFLFQQARMV
jgi:hypothetical protein